MSHSSLYSPHSSRQWITQPTHTGFRPFLDHTLVTEVFDRGLILKHQRGKLNKPPTLMIYPLSLSNKRVDMPFAEFPNKSGSLPNKNRGKGVILFDDPLT
nr:MAG TPA: hypothetical protein [Caudoviricetes sp.]